jgi:RecJ-like exonuclease
MIQFITVTVIAILAGFVLAKLAIMGIKRIQRIPCRFCHGKGKVDFTPEPLFDDCEHCGGKGYYA